MLFSRKAIVTKGKQPLYAASRVLNVSSATAQSAFARCWVHGTNRTSALIRTVRNRGFSRAYSTKPTGSEGSNTPGGSGLDTSTLPLYRKLIDAWTQTPVKWYPLPLAVGALLLVVIQYRKKRRRPEIVVDEHGVEIVKLRGPWQFHVMGSLPLRNMSRLWGYLNSLELPIWLRPYGFRLYAKAFGCNLDEIEHDDLTHYVSLGDFFYRKLKDGARPIDAAILVSPADGTVLHFGKVKDLRVEQVKGLTYSLDALLGVERPNTPPPASAVIRQESMPIVDDREFANVNGIEYSLHQLLGGASSSGTTTPVSESPSSSQPPSLPLQGSHSTPEPSSSSHPKKFGEQTDASVVEPDRNMQETLAHDAGVALEMGVKPSLKRTLSSWHATSLKPGNSLFFTVIYLAPGDYHRFHSPTAWVVEKRRHFTGELFSVSPYMAKRLENLFVLNERVALLGRWRYGFFGMIPVGATNVGSIKINFDEDLRTNLRRPRRRLRPPPGSYTEAVYSAASPILGGQPLTYGQEMGGFALGSTIVLVFEAPDDFEFTVQAGQKVKVGQKLGDLSTPQVAIPTPKNNSGFAKPKSD